VICVVPVRPPVRLLELALVIGLVAGGTWLRWQHLGAPSLWWDEMVHVRMADQPTLRDVWRVVRDGVPPGAGNAGAVPLDYLALHAWLRATPAPAPSAMERHYRVPAFVFATAALPVMWAVGRAVGGPATGAIALALLATSIPHVLYAAEARFYALCVLATLVSVAAFVGVVRTGTGRAAALLTVANVAYVLTALYGIFPIAAEYAVLAWIAWRRRGRNRGAVLALALGAGALVAVLAAYLTRAAVGVVFTRGFPAYLSSTSALIGTFTFFASDRLVVAALTAAAVALAPFVVRGRDGAARTLAVVVLLSLASVPVIVYVARAKHYYYHPRHAIFLLPLVLLSTAMVVGPALARGLRSELAAACVGVALVVGGTWTLVRAYVTDPMPFFRQTKTLRDLRALTAVVAARSTNAAPGERYLVALSRGRPGHLANASLAFYVDAYGLTDRVALAGANELARAADTLAAACPDACRGAAGGTLATRLTLGDPFDQPAPMREFLALPPEGPLKPPARLAGAALVVWAPDLPPKAPGCVATSIEGLTLIEPR